MIYQLDNDYSNFIMIVKTVDLEALPASHFLSREVYLPIPSLIPVKKFND